MSPDPSDNVETFVQKEIIVTGLEIVESAVWISNPDEIYRKTGQNQDPFIISIPHNADSIESHLEYLLVLCLKSTANLRRVHAKAKLERTHPNDKDNSEPIQLLDDDGSAQIPFPGNPDASNNYYHRWWKWPKTPLWREPDNYIMRVWLGYNKWNPAPVAESDWISKPFTFKINIEKRDPPKS